MGKFKLLKDLPWCKAGTIMVADESGYGAWVECGSVPWNARWSVWFLSGTNIDTHLPRFPDWFERVEDNA